jgi:hypothetical protein
MALHALIALGPLLVSYWAGTAPLYRPLPTGAACLVAVLLLAALLVRGTTRWTCSLARVAAAQALALAAIAACTAAALHWNLSALSVDSFGQIELGLGLARVRDPQWTNLGVLGAHPVFAMILHASTDLSGVEYLYFLPPILWASSISTLSVASFSAIRLLHRSTTNAALTTSLGVIWLCSSYFVVFHGVYVHVNWIAAMYLLLFFFCTWMALITRESGYWKLAAVAAFSFSISRVEGPLFLAFFLCLLALERRGSERRLASALALALPSAVWCIAVAGVVGDGGRIVDRERLALMTAGLLASVGLAWAMRYPAFAVRARALQWTGPALLVLALAAMLARRPEHMVDHSLVHVLNAALFGNWATGWIIPASLALALPLLGRIPHQRFLLLAITGFVLLTLDMTYFGTWRRGWFDSGNRMLMHALPTTAWALMVMVGAIAPAQRLEPTPRSPDLDAGRAPPPC